MKHLKINTEQYNILLSEFNRWLKIKRKSRSVIEKYPIALREFFHYMENTVKIKEENCNSLFQVWFQPQFGSGRARKFFRVIICYDDLKTVAVSTKAVNHQDLIAL